MSTRMRRPEAVTITITLGDWLLLKKYLTAGERRRIYAASVQPMLAGQSLPMVDSVEAGVSTVLAYLLDWSITDADGKPVVIRDQPDSVKRAALDNLDADSFTEIQRAVQKHEAEMDVVRDQEKNVPDGGIASSATSSSADSCAGPLTTSSI